ncbi:MAG: SMC-Scp complex subunit ScpB [Saprospiraceae bacterium]|nr:SMC-Scp complex subunit ScpB [Saprospiraceae bacterium]
MDLLALHIESLIFATEQPITLKEIRSCLDACLDSKVKKEDLLEAIEKIKTKYQSDHFAFELSEINHGYVFLTKGAHHHIVGEYLRQHTRKMLSKAALETLAIIAYKQPVTKIEVESIRGVNCDYTIQKLLDKELIAIKGRSDGPGRPLIYETSERFMDHFGLKTLDDLPKLKDFKQPDSEIGNANSIVEEAIRTSNQN